MRRAGLAIAVVLAMALPAVATHQDGDATTGTFNPQMAITPEATTVDTLSGVTFIATQADHQEMVHTYRFGVPAGWRLAAASPDASTFTSCRQATPTNALANMEYVGLARLTVNTDPRRQPDSLGRRQAPFEFEGGVWFLKWDATAQAATLCGVVRGPSGAPVRDLVFQATLSYLGAAGGELTFDFAAVPGAPAGERSIIDNATYQSQNASVLEVLFKLNGNTGGNFHRDASGALASVAFSRTPATAGHYTFDATFTPCAATSPLPCRSDAPPANRSIVMPITSFPTGFHPVAKLTAPANWTIVRGTNVVSAKWAHPSTAAGDPVRGYVLTVNAQNAPSAKHARILVTDPAAPGYSAAVDPCLPGPTCQVDLAFPLALSGGGTLPADGTYEMTLTTIFADGHRSDGRCDDGTVAGALPPCADGSTPRWELPGNSLATFMIRQGAWPHVYRQIINRTDGKGVAQVYVLLANFSTGAWEFVEWKPVGTSWTGGGATGANGVGGGFASWDGNKRYGFEGAATPTAARGLFLKISPFLVVEESISFNGSAA